MALEINAPRKVGVFPTLFFSQKMKAPTFNISSYGFISCETLELHKYCSVITVLWEFLLQENI